ncbi:hypothetical protein V2P39_00930 [Mycoplasma capricolum subsp. capricolum]|uniref:hypothetical protein n=1 Tax=Mycoplasma capricolum TaxID=2095 RepID=UPI003DA4FCFB
MEKDFLFLKIYDWLSNIFMLLTVVFVATNLFKNTLVFWILSGVCFIFFGIFMSLFSTKADEIKDTYR